ncbi:MAG TPA: PAS domain S-box protein, partial [Candidatus Saccharimonadia bacterium]|nr:PAS domain S-box protein [Candidatus Saccharimonadia bacterium]
EAHYKPAGRWLQVRVYPSSDGVTLYVQDVSERRVKEQQLARQNRLYQMLSRTNEAIVRRTDSRQLFEAVCHVAVEQGQFLMALIVELDGGSGKTREVAHAGANEGLFSKTSIDISAAGQSSGTIGTAFRTGRYDVCNDFANDPRTAAWRSLAQRGFQSTASFPIKADGQILAVLVLVSGEPDYFLADEIELLATMAENVSFAIESLNMEQQRQSAEAALRASEASMAAAQRIAHFGSWELEFTNSDDIDTCREHWSDEMFRITGLEPGKMEVTTRLFFQLVHPGDREPVRHAIAKSIRERRQYSINHRLVRPNGEERVVHQTVQPFFDEMTGQPLKVVGTTHDITEQTLARREIKRTSDLMRAVADGTPDAFFVKDLQGRYLLFNEGAARLVGRSIEDVIGRDDTALFDPEGARMVMENDRQVMEAGKTKLTEEILTAAGVKRTYLVTKVPYRDSQGNVIGLIGLSRDITEWKQAEEKLLEQATLLDHAQDAILVRGLDHEILYWNRSAERLYGWTAEEALGHSIRELLYPGSKDAFVNATDTVVKKGEWSGELEQTNKDGRVLAVECHWTLVRDALGNPKSILAINTDITRRKKVEQQFLRAQRMESIGTLAGGIAHDLNNVLAPITMSIDLLKLGETNEKKLNVLSVIEGSAHRGAEMVKQVLTFARGVDGQQLQVQVGRVVKEIEKIANDTFLKNVQIRSKIPPDLWVVRGDPTQLHQVLLNLSVNARDAMPKGGRLTISACNMLLDEHYASMSLDAKPGPYVVIKVEDTGTGMPPEVMERIFEPFYTTKELGKGTGLGLSTSMAIVKSHGGFMRVSSEQDAGTTFSVYLPAQSESAGEGDDLSEEDLPRGNGELVLVVDDEAAVREITRQTLEMFGYKVLLACDGAEATAIYAVQKQNISVVLTDMMMPVMDGPVTIQVLMRMNPKVRIIAASGLNAAGMVAKAANIGAQHFLPKPYTAMTLLTVLKQVLGSKA